MGGETTGSTEATKNVFIESAYFDPVRTAATGRKAGLQTDARYRFERGVDPAYVKGGPRSRDRHDSEALRRRADENEDRRQGAGRKARHRLRFDARRRALRREAAARRDQEHSRSLGVQVRGRERRRQGDGADVAAGYPWPRRSGRRSRAHRRPRQDPIDAAAAHERRGAACADRETEALAAGSAAARGARNDGSGDVVVHQARPKPSTSAAARRSWNSPTRSRAKCRRCARAYFRASSRQ